MKKWLITDTHFNHDNLRNGKLTSVRPWDYQEQIIKNWNELVQVGDLVYHLGDVIFARRYELADIMKNLNGTKILIRGNHDNYDVGHKRKKIQAEPDFYIRNGFIAVMEAVVEQNMILLSHAPMKLGRDISMNIHGHFHDNDHRTYEPWYMDMMRRDNRYRLLSVELEGYKPVTLDEFVRRG